MGTRQVLYRVQACKAKIDPGLAGFLIQEASMERVLRCSIIKAVTILICLLGLARTGFSTSVIIPSDDDLVISARAIVTGTVLSMGTGFDDEQERVYTYVTLQVEDVLKGAITQQEIILKQEGGQFGDRGEILYGTPDFSVGERVLVYLDTWADGSLRVHQMFLGKFSIVKDPATGQEMAVRASLRDDVVTVPTVSNKAKATNRMELNAYKEMLRERLAANLARSTEFQNAYYGNVPMYARPLNYDAEKARGGILPSFVTISPLNPRWFEPDSGLPVSFKVNPDNAPYATVNDDITAAMNAWTHVNGIPLEVIIGGTTSSCSPSLSENTIIFNGCDGRWSPSSGCQGVLALGGLSWTGASITIEGTTFRKAAAGFISFNPYTCYFSNHCNVQEVTTHELGHALGLGHSQFSVATMWGVAHFDGRCASIKQDDIDGISFLYPPAGGGGGGGGGSPLAITTSSLPSGTVGSTYSQSLAASGGTQPYSWSLATGSGPLPSGLNLSSSGVISGVPASSGTSSFSIKVMDSAGASSQKAFAITVNGTSSQNYDSIFLSQTVPQTLQPGQQFTVNLKWQNTGTATWNGYSGFRVGSQNPANNGTWGGNTVLLPGFVIPAGQTLDLSFNAFAPVEPGLYDFQWQLVQDNVFFGQMSSNAQIAVGVITDESPPAMSGSTSLTAVKAVAFSYQWAASGGTPPYTWSIASGTVPAGLGLNAATGTLSGTPTDTGNFTVAVKVTDSAFLSDQKTVAITVEPPPAAQIEVTTSSIPDAGIGATFIFSLEATGGTPPYTWSIAGGTFPAGLSLNSTTGVISGVAASAGNFLFTVQVTDSASHKAQKDFSIKIKPAPLSIDAVPQMEVMMGAPLFYQPKANGGTLPYTWSMTGGALPAGVGLNTSTGTISGTPTVSGTFDFSISVKDGNQTSASTAVQIKVIDPASIPQITNAKYKPAGRKLIVKGERFDPTARVRVDGGEINVSPKNSHKFVIKRFPLDKGPHTVVVVNSSGGISQSVTFTVK